MNVSSGSGVVSPITRTTTSAWMIAGVNVSAPPVAGVVVVGGGRRAVGGRVVDRHRQAARAERVTVNVMPVVPLLPSACVTLLMARPIDFTAKTSKVLLVSVTPETRLVASLS